MRADGTGGAQVPLRPATDPVPAVSAGMGRSVSEVVDRLREQILDRVLLPGEQIRQEEMAGRLGISRVPLREALRVLTSEGLLTHRPHQGYFVARLSSVELRQIHSLLMFLETELLRHARWPDEAELCALGAVNRAMADAAAAHDLIAVNRLNREFHHRIFALSALEVYRGEAEKFWTMSDPYRLLHVSSTNTEIATEQHQQLIDALGARDRALVLRVLDEHRRETHVAALSVLDDGGPGGTDGPVRAVG